MSSQNNNNNNNDNDEELIEAFGFDDDAQNMERERKERQKQKQERILQGSDHRLEKTDELSKEAIEKISKLSPSEREQRWGFTHDELKAAAKVVSTLFSNPHLFVGDSVLAETRLYTMVSRDRATKRGNPEMVKKMLAQEQARKKQVQKAHDMAALQKTKMKQERDAALNALLIAGPNNTNNNMIEDNKNKNVDSHADDDDDNEDDGPDGSQQMGDTPTSPVAQSGYKIILTQVFAEGDNDANKTNNNDDEGDDVTTKPAATLKKSKSCQICHNRFTELHHFYYSLCPSCAELNFAKRHQKRDLRGRNVLLTGCRIKIGYEMALSLLRCGANLIGTTRFIHDCLNRFMQEKDYDEWKDRVHLFALDMRDLWMVEHFCEFIKTKFKNLFAIVNNAAQTIARTVSYTESLRFFESDPLPQVRETLMARNDTVEWMSFFAENCSLKIGHPLQLEHRPLTTGPHTIQEKNTETTKENNQNNIADDDEDENAEHHVTVVVSSNKNNSATSSYQRPIYDRYDTAAEASDLRTKSSWTAKLADVEGNEAAEVMAINALAPLIINARLRCVLEAAVEFEEETTGNEKPSPSKQRFPRPYPLGPDPEEKRFIINVSAMEGMFYRKKSVTHPHTNMAKAALNMMTRTSGEDYAESGIFINSADTGWVTDESIDSKRQKQWTGELPLLPIDEVDAAMRCLDLIYNNSSEHSKFWKDYKQIPW